MRVVQFLSGLVVAGGVGALLWYQSLSDSEQEQADRLAAQYAWDLFEKSVDQLNFLEARQVHRLAGRAATTLRLGAMPPHLIIQWPAHR